ncbi:hypothetical protein SMD20_20450 [Nonomuraea sp. LP-02]|uniref:hypothetical protein n=1 Tax=Nonomuraea sp. LP-02 TaxID=3097960 RepID=UPI002E35DBDE|nr:hypothetical protein [Nonomuraea sp. LP-02]MED7926640.1 hypothetical protein [Nonomuraea sp. LP-02]
MSFEPRSREQVERTIEDVITAARTEPGLTTLWLPCCLTKSWWRSPGWRDSVVHSILAPEWIAGQS